VSPVARTQSSWWQANYDRLILVALLVILLGSAAFLVQQVGWERTKMTEAAWERPHGIAKGATPVDLSDYHAKREAFFHPFQIEARTNALMISELRVSCVHCGKPIAFTAATCPFCGTAQPERKDPEKVDTDGDGLPDVVETKFGLNPMDPQDAAQDSDGDGFSNIEEIQYGTDPAAADSYPPPVVKLRLLRAQRVPFKLRFQGISTLANGQVRYQVNLRTLERTFFAQVGEEVEGFKVVEYQPDAAAGPTLVIKQGETTIPLALGQAITEQELVADIISLLDRTRRQVRIGDTLTVKDFKYNVVDIRREGVLLRDEKSGKETLVGMLTDSEKLLMLQSAGLPSAAGAVGR
jgi:hypothetical protein